MLKKSMNILLGALLVFVFISCEKESTSMKVGADIQTQKSESIENELPEIYSLVGSTSLGGLQSPYMEDRAAIEKAWPRKLKNDNEIVVGWTELTMSNPWFVAVADGADSVASKYGNITIKRQVADLNVQTQSSQIDSFITQNVDVIVINPADAVGVVSDIKRAVNAGIPVICSAGIPDFSAPILTCIACSPYENGYEVGKYLGKQYPTNEHIDIAMIIGVLGNPTPEGRLNGMLSGFLYQRLLNKGSDIKEEDAMLMGYNLFNDIIKTGKCNSEDADFSVLSMGVGNWTDEGGLDAAEDILTAYGSELEIFFAENDFMGIGAVKAIENIDMGGKIDVACCADGFREALEYIESGKILTTGRNSGTKQGEEVIEFVNMIFNENYDPNDMPMCSFFEPGVISRDNLDDYYDPNNNFFMHTKHEFLTLPELKEKLNNM